MFKIPKFLYIYQNQFLTELLKKLAMIPELEESRAETARKNNEKERVKIITHPGQASVVDLLLLVAITIQYTEKNTLVLDIPLEWYYTLRCVNDKTYMRKQLINALEYLERIEFAYYESHSRSWQEVCIFQIKPFIKNRAIHVELSQSMTHLMPRQKMMPLPINVFCLKRGEHSATRLLITWYICQNMRINHAEKGVITIRTLLNAASNLRRYDELDASRHVNRDIINQIEEALLRSSSWLRWKYRHCKHAGEKWDWWEYYNSSILVGIYNPSVGKDGKVTAKPEKASD